MIITPKMAAEIAAHEGIVLEAYKDSVGVWTWGVGVTTASGHSVERYIDKPQSMERVIEVFQWLLAEKYLPSVERAFAGHTLTEAQLTAALSFHYNTGAIQRASWVRHWKAGKIKAARKSFMAWKKPAAIIPRRKAECDLFFDGKWHSRGRAVVYPVSKPRYTPNWGKGRSVDVLSLLSPTQTQPKPDYDPQSPHSGIFAGLLALWNAISKRGGER